MARAKVRAIFSIAELAALAGITRYSMSRLLRAQGVPVHAIGHKRWVYLCEVRVAMPLLWQSIREFREIAPFGGRPVRPRGANCEIRPISEGSKAAKKGDGTTAPGT